MISIRQWFIQNGKRPLIATLSLIVGLISFYNIRAYIELEQTQLMAADALSSLVSIGLAQKNRTLLESILDDTHWQLHSKMALLCNDSEAVLKSGSSEELNLCHKFSNNLPNRVVSKNIPGFEGYYIRMTLPRIPEMSATILLGLTGLWILTMCFLLVAKVQMRFSKDIIGPLSEGLLDSFKNPSEQMRVLELENIRLSMIEATRLKVEHAVNAALVKTSLQVSHDIRAPLAALNVVSSSLPGADADTKILLQQAIDRIRNVSEALLKKNRDKSSLSNDFGHHKFMHCLETITTQLKREVMDRAILEINSNEDVLDVEAIFQPDQLLRILSNLINNSLEASASRIYISIARESTKLRIAVKDNGHGIASENLSRIGERGFTFGKESGNGLGISSAKAILDSWGGTLGVESDVNKGTTIKMFFSIKS